MNENELAKVICRAYLEKTFNEMRTENVVTAGNGPAVQILIERDVKTKWQKFLPEARAVMKLMMQQGII